MSQAVYYEISRIGEHYQLTVTADNTWINTEDRAFPVTIDPTCIVSTTSCYDTYIDSENPNTNYGSSSMLRVGDGMISYIKTPDVVLPPFATLDWAYFTVFYFYTYGITSGNTEVTVSIDLHKCNLSSFNEDTLTWGNVSAMSNFGLGTAVIDTKTTYANVEATTSEPKQLDFAITEILQGWVDGNEPKYSFGLKYNSSSTNPSVFLKSYDSGYDYRPRITYKYEAPTLLPTSGYEIAY